MRSGHPVLVFLNLGWDFYPIWHYAVVIGYRPGRDAFLLHSGTERRKVMAARNNLARILAARGSRSLALAQIERALANALPAPRERIRAMPADGADCQPAAGMR